MRSILGFALALAAAVVPLAAAQDLAAALQALPACAVRQVSRASSGCLGKKQAIEIRNRLLA